MFSLASHSLSRTASVSSLGSDDSIASSGANASTSTADGTIKRTRKRFTSVQLMMLEHLYHKASHPTRELREQVAKEADIDIRSVTVWFQNKRQTDRRLHRQLSETPTCSSSQQQQPSASPTAPLPLPPSSPFSDASGNTIHTVRARARTRTLSGTSSISAMSATSRKREREAQDPNPPARRVRHKPCRHLSLDDVAARAERPALIPRMPPQVVVASPGSTLSSEELSSPVRPVTPDPKLSVVTTGCGRGGVENDDDGDEDGRERALWENMPSSPIAPDPDSSSLPRSERDIDVVRYGGAQRRITLEYACAREIAGFSVRGMERDKEDKEGERHREGRERKKDKSRHRHHGADVERKLTAVERVSGQGHRLQRHAHAHWTGRETVTVKEEEEDENEDGDEEDVPVADYDAQGGDTDTEGAPSEPPVTPSSSFALGEFRAMTMEEDEEEDSDNTVTCIRREVLVETRKDQEEPMAVQVEIARDGPDDELMDVAYVLCGLRQRR